MSNVQKLPVPLTINEHFMMAFLDAEAPCATVGLVEEGGAAKGFLGLRFAQPPPVEAFELGGQFGIGLLGTGQYEILHTSLLFPKLGAFDLLLNPANPIVGKVVDVMRETREYFFFIVERGSMLALHNSMDDGSADWFETYGSIVHTSTTTPDEYDRGSGQLVQREDVLHGTPLPWVCRNEMTAIDLEHNRMQCGWSGG